MKKFKFTLEGALKLRKFKEQKIKIEIGNVVKRMEWIKQEMLRADQDIVSYYDEQKRMFSGVIAEIGRAHV